MSVKEDWKVSKFKILNFLAIIITLVAMLMTFVIRDYSSPPAEDFSTSYPLKLEQFASSYDRINELENQLNELQADIDTLSSLPEDSDIAYQLSQIKKSNSELKDRLRSLEKVILDNPSKALEIPLLEKDLENLERRQQIQSTIMKSNINRIYDLNKWLLGAMAISIITLAISNYLKAD